MAHFLVRRFLRAIVTIWGVVTLIFLLMHLIPGDAVTMLLGEVGPKAAEQMRHFLGLDRPLHVQYFEWLFNVLQGDLGKSLLSDYPVSQLLMERFPVTLELTFLTILLGILIAFPFGMLAARKHGSWIDLLAMQFAQLGISVPNFWIATILIIFVAVRLQWLPPSGYVEPGTGLTENLKSMALPAISLALPLAAVLTRVVRSAMLEVLSQDYMRTARAKGLAENRVIWRHGLKNAFIPILTVIGMEIGYLMGGTVIIEELFAFPGLGKQTVTAMLQRDLPVLQGTLLLYATVFVFINLLVDLSYGLIDPRVRYE